MSLGKWNEKLCWHISTIFISVVLNSFIKRLLQTKSSVLKTVFNFSSGDKLLLRIIVTVSIFKEHIVRMLSTCLLYHKLQTAIQESCTVIKDFHYSMFE